MEKNCKECLHNPVCQMWRDQEGQDASSFQLSGCIHFDTGKAVPGRWEEWWPGISLIMTGEEMLYRCSACDAKYADVDGYKFCPNCGAKMDGVEDNGC